MNKRILSVLLVALMAVALVVGAISVSAAGEPNSSFGWDSEGGYSTIEEAAKAHKDIYLKDDWDGTTTQKLGHTFSIDLNGYTMACDFAIYDKDSTAKNVTATFTNSEGANKKLDIPTVTVNNENGPKKADGTYPAYTLTVDNVTVGEIVLKGSSKATLKNIPKVYNASTKTDDVTTKVSLIGKTEVTVESGDVLSITSADGKSTVYVKGGKVGTISGVDKVVVSGGEVTTIDDVDTVEITGGKVGTLTNVDDATVNGGSVAKVGKNVDLVLLKGTVDDIANETTTTVIVKSAEIAGHVDKDGKNIMDQQARITGTIGDGTAAMKCDVTIIRGYVSSTDENSVDAILKCRAEYGTVALYGDVYVEVKDKNQTLNYTAEYVFGEKLIEKHVLDSYTFENIVAGVGTHKTLSGADWEVIYSNEHCEMNITATGTGNYVLTDSLHPLENAKVYVNGYLLGSNLQPGGVVTHVYDWLKSITTYTVDDHRLFSITGPDSAYTPNAEYIHKWATELTKKTEPGTVTCDKERVLQDYFADTLNPGKFFAKPDENGKIERQYNQDVEKDGAVIGSGHILTYHPYVAASEGKDGNDAYYTCDNCSKYFSKDIAVVYKGSVGVKAASEYEIPGVPTIKADPKETKAPETTAAPAETTAAPAETTKAPAETTAAPAETTAAPETQAPKPVTPSETGDNGMNALVWVIVLGAAVTGVAVASKSVLASKKH